MIKCMYCKNPSAQVLGVTQVSYFTIKQMKCGKCGKSWKDFDGDVLLPATKEPPKELVKV